MSDDQLVSNLMRLGLSGEEVKVYLKLLQRAHTIAQLQRATGIARTTIYRILDKLGKRNLIITHVDEEGSSWVASDPKTLEVSISSQEAALQQQRSIVSDILPHLLTLQSQQNPLFVVHTYDGDDGFKQMCWNELKTKGILYCLGYATIEQLIPSRFWAEKYRTLSSRSDYTVREIKNDGQVPPTLSESESYMKRYSCRTLPKNTLQLDNQVTIYNDTVAIYHWAESRRVGVEIVNKDFATMMRNIAEHYWEIAKPYQP